MGCAVHAAPNVAGWVPQFRFTRLVRPQVEFMVTLANYTIATFDDFQQQKYITDVQAAAGEGGVGHNTYFAAAPSSCNYTHCDFLITDMLCR